MENMDGMYVASSHVALSNDFGDAERVVGINNIQLSNVLAKVIFLAVQVAKMEPQFSMAQKLDYGSTATLNDERLGANKDSAVNMMEYSVTLKALRTRKRSEKHCLTTE